MKDKKAAALLIVLGIILVVTVLVNVVLQIMLNQSKLSQHQVARIQAYYAANAGIVYAFEKLRTSADGKVCPEPVCDYQFATGDFFPASIKDRKVSIEVKASGVGGCSAPAGTSCISATVDYTPTT